MIKVGDKVVVTNLRSKFHGQIFVVVDVGKNMYCGLGLNVLGRTCAFSRDEVIKVASGKEKVVFT